MLHSKKIIVVLALLLLAGIVFGASQSGYFNAEIRQLELIPISGDSGDAVLIYETGTLSFYFRDERDVLSIVDKRNGYTWKSGLDIPEARKVREGLRQGIAVGYEPIEERMNATYTAIANSLITIEYYDQSLGIKRVSSTSESSTSTLYGVKNSESHFVLDVYFEEIDLSVRVNLHLSDEGYTLAIGNEDLLGEGKSNLAAILLNPFLGASGGMHSLYDETTNRHGNPVYKDNLSGYVFVPDGPGSLIPFQDYGVSLTAYSSMVYGQNHSKATYNQQSLEDSFVPLKSPLMPLYGIAHTDYDAAFLGYATKGDTGMEIVVMPRGNTTLYTWAYPRFVYNSAYYQVFNKRGEGYFTLFNEPFNLDIEFNYVFLASDETKETSADYIGMAKAYRSYLESEGILTKRDQSHKAPIRLDFVMSDQKKSVIGLENVVVTTAENVMSILKKLSELGIDEMSSGLYGWQDGGVTVGKPWQAKWSRAIGSKGDFNALHDFAKKLSIDVSFAQDYLKINTEQTNVQRHRTKHSNNWYLKADLSDNYPVREFYYAKPQVSVDWLNRQVSALKDLNILSHTIEGITSTLLSHHDRRSSQLSESETVGVYKEALEKMHGEYALNLKTPNQYLWAYTDRFLQAPVYASGYLIQSETVPFLSFLLNGTMEIFAPYGNFSFYNDSDFLKLVDYNLSPSFVITQEAAYLLSDTNLMNYYSTEYSEYEQLILKAYTVVNEALNRVRNADWVSRKKLDDDVYINTYDNGLRIVINYSNRSFNYLNQIVEPVSYRIFEKEGP